MDPIHPIVPVAPDIPPVTPAPTTGRIGRDTPRENLDQNGRRRKRSGSAPLADPSPSAERSVDGRGDDDDSSLHVDVIA